MRSLVCVLAGLAVSLSVQAVSQTSPALNCKAGPVNKTYGGTRWLVYACDDKRSLSIVAAPGSPAAPFTFSFVADSTGYDLRGQGKGNRKVTDAAYKDLQALTGPTIRALVAEAGKH